MKYNAGSIARRIQKITRLMSAALLMTPILTVFTPTLNLSIPLAAPQVLAQSTDARKTEADRLLQQGLEQFNISQFSAALQSWQQALTLYREIKDRLGEGAALGGLGIAYLSLGDYAKAIEYHQQSLALAREIKDRLVEGQSLGNLGAAYLSLGNYAKAIEYQQQRLAIAREIKDRLGEGQSLGNLGIAYRSLGDYAKAIEYQQQQLAIAREIKDRQGEGNALGNLGLAYGSLGNYAKAIEYHQQSLALAREIKDRLGEGRSLGDLGSAYLSLGDYAKAIEYQQQSLALAREIKDRLGEGHALGNLGLAYYSLGDYAKAIEYHQQFLAIAREIKDRLGEGHALGNLGIAYYSLGDYAKAIEYQQQRLAIAREIKDRRGEGQSLGNLGNAYNSLGNYAKAIEYHQQYLAIAREIKDRQSEGVALGNLGSAYFFLGDYAKAIKYHQQSLAIAREIHDRLGEGQSLNNLGAAFYKQGNLAAAEKTLFDGIKVYESLRNSSGNDANKVSIFETQTNTYGTLQKVLIAEKKSSAALEIAERGRARAFVELLATQISTTKQSTINAPTIKQIKQIASAQNATLVEYSIVYDEFKISGKQQYKESQLYIWVIKPTGEISFKSVDLKPLWQKQNTNLASVVADARCFDNTNCLQITQVASRGGEFNVAAQNAQTKPIPTTKSRNKQLRQLHQLLIQPIAHLLPTDANSRVIFIPQKELFLVPFPALIDAKNQFLIEKHTILTSPSIQTLELTRQIRQRVQKARLQNSVVVGIPRQKAVVVGNPVMPWAPRAPGETPERLPALPGAEAEAKAIAPLLQTSALTGASATKAAVVPQMAQARIIHLATHGLLNDERGLGTVIALAPTANDNGLLTAEEIFKLKLNAELVVLSACNSGRGRITGDGIIGLSRSFISAGVPSVIVSLWAIPDVSTAFLMKTFYQKWQQDPKKDKAKALREAMLATMKQNPDPKDWAAFTLIGEAN